MERSQFENVVGKLAKYTGWSHLRCELWLRKKSPLFNGVSPMNLIEHCGEDKMFRVLEEADILLSPRKKNVF